MVMEDGKGDDGEWRGCNVPFVPKKVGHKKFNT